VKTFTLDRRKRKIPSNPPIEFAEKILEEARGYSKIVSIGGGSTIDVGKYVSFHLSIPHRAVPTTAGTGSEVTKFAVFTKDGRKFSMEDERLIPEEYVLNPTLVTTLPRLQTASTGLDALSQAVESLWSPDATEKSKKFSEEAIKRVMSTLIASCENPKNELFRKIMLEAANYSGRAINITRTSICHAISYPLTSIYGIPHGIACAVSLPYFIDYFGVRYVRAWEVLSLIRTLNLGLRTQINKRLIARQALESLRSKNVPKKITEKEIYKSLSPNDRRPFSRRAFKNY